MRPTELLASSLLLFTAATSAWPSGWGELAVDIAPLLKRQGIVVRQDDSSDNGDSSSQQDDTPSATKTSADSDVSPTSSEDGDAKTTQKDDNSSASGTGTKTTKETGTQSGGKSGTKTSGDSTKTFDARLPAGGVSMITPNPMTTQYYKIKDYVTFAWNYTSLKASPQYVDVLATCSKNQEIYTIATNLSVDATQTVVWDTGAYQSNATIPLLTETYTLIIHDAAKDVSAAPSPGYLGTYNQFTFGMYTPQAYTPIADYVCATCNSAINAMERQTMWAIFAMVGVTVMSFGWFTGVAGLW